MNARTAPWIVALATVAALSAGCALGIALNLRRARACEVPCSSSLHIEATGPATYTLTCGAGR